MANIVQFDNVGLRYGTGAETLSDVSFSLASGSFYFLTGPSGELAENPDVREFYLGVRDAGVRGTRRWRRKKQWR